MDGLLLVDKKKDITSYDVIRRIKNAIRVSDKYLESKPPKIGHAGTLDPFASGLLIVLFGKATKMTEKIHQYSKVYTVTAEFGYETDTQDSTGKVVARDIDNSALEESDLSAEIAKMTGEQFQTPPSYSAKKIKGRPAYLLARKGEAVLIPPKKIEIFKFELVESAWPKVSFTLEVSTGTYIRTVVADFAKRLNRHATAVELLRSSIGPYRLEDSISVDSILSLSDIESNLIKV